eukprot:156575-Chlamydomonas_euryale.AAC.7
MLGPVACLPFSRLPEISPGVSSSFAPSCQFLLAAVATLDTKSPVSAAGLLRQPASQGPHTGMHQPLPWAPTPACTSACPGRPAVVTSRPPQSTRRAPWLDAARLASLRAQSQSSRG